MEKGKGLARRWAVEFAENSSYSSSTSDVPDPIGFNRSASDPVLPSLFVSRFLIFSHRSEDLFWFIYLFGILDSYFRTTQMPVDRRRTPNRPGSRRYWCVRVLILHVLDFRDLPSRSRYRFRFLPLSKSGCRFPLLDLDENCLWNLLIKSGLMIMIFALLWNNKDQWWRSDGMVFTLFCEPFGNSIGKLNWWKYLFCTSLSSKSH